MKDLTSDFIEEIGFTQNAEDNLRWDGKCKYWNYRIWFEGYAYVLYLIWRDNEVPIHEFRDAETFKTFWNILSTYPSDEDE